MTLLFALATVFSAVQARIIETVYIDGRNFPGGPWAYYMSHLHDPISVSFYATLFVLTFLGDLLVVSTTFSMIYMGHTHLTYSYGAVG